MKTNLDVAIIGAGAAGIAAGRVCAEHKLNFRIFEARNRVGGRAHTLNFDGQPLDLGAHWMHMSATNPLVPHAAKLKIETLTSSGSYPRYENGQRQSDELSQNIGKAWAITEANALLKATAINDLSVADCMPTPETYPQHKSWLDALAFGHSLYSGRAAEEVSAFDYARVDDSENLFPKGGYGLLVEKLSHNLPIELNTPVTHIDWSGEIIILHTAKDYIYTKKLIITVPTMVLAKGRIKFYPPLPQAHSNAIHTLKPAAYEHVIIKWIDHPFIDGANQLTLFNGDRYRNISILAEIEGSSYHYVEVGGQILTDFKGTSEQKKAFSVEIALGELKKHFGSDLTNSIELVHVTDWWNDEYSAGSWSVAPPNAALSRETLQTSIDHKIWFAGEASSPSQWGTVGGAWLEGERATREILNAESI